MKKRNTIILAVALFIIIAAIVAFTFGRPSSKEKQPLSQQTKIEVVDSSLHLGTFRYNEKREGVYHIKNIGDTPLVILKIATSCNCTELEWPRKPILPGATAEIKLTYIPNETGKFNKTIDLHCNTRPQITTLRVNGYIEE